jgi:hypothetical protein
MCNHGFDFPASSSAKQDIYHSFIQLLAENSRTCALTILRNCPRNPSVSRNSASPNLMGIQRFAA